MAGLTVDIVDLCGPKEEHDKVVATTKKGDEKDDNHSLLGFAEKCLGYHWIWRKEFPDEERDDENDAENEWRDIVCTTPGILSSVSILVREV